MTKLNIIKDGSISLSNRVDSGGYIAKTMLPHWTRLLIWSLQLPRGPYLRFCTRLMKLWNNNGSTFVVLYCKEATRIVQAYVSGNSILVSNQFPIHIVAGLPWIIPGNLRSLMRQGDLNCIRGVLSILAVYRVISIPGKVKLSTITDPFKGLCDSLPHPEIKKSLIELIDSSSFRLLPISLSLRGTAGPNHPVSMLGIWKDIKAWSESPLLPILKEYILKSRGGSEFWTLIEQEIEHLESLKQSDSRKFVLGTLSEKEEAAGKVRVFAITDSITQSVLEPLHEGIFSSLKTILMDGTFDQDAPVRHLKDLFEKGLLNGQTFYSYDLSAATDRLPLVFQQQVLACLIGTDRAVLWGKLLASRDWYFHGKPFKYTVGQPMGALSSWAMLALSHHVVVRIAANRVGLPEFTHYALLGDDIVIANTAVAKSYHYIMTELLGVDINLSKSLVSSNSFEFAKRLVTMKGEVSPVGPKNLLVALKSLKGLPSVLLDLRNKGLDLTEETVTKMYQSVPTVRKTQLKQLVWLVNGPFGFVPTENGLSPFTRLNNSLSSVSLHAFLSMIDKVIYDMNLNTWFRNLVKMDKIISSILALEELPGFTGDWEGSPLFQHILDIYYKEYYDLIHSKPKLNPTLLGPVFVSKYLQKDHTQEVVKLITSRIKSNEGVTYSSLDPFQVEKVILPLSSTEGPQKFWKAVYEEDRKMRSMRGIRGMLASQIIKVRR